MNRCIEDQNIATGLQACRGCLTTDRKLHNIHQYQLAEHFKHLIGESVFISEGLPQHLCYFCANLVAKFATFRKRCLRAHNVLIDSKIQGKIVNTEHVQTIDHERHDLCLTYAQTLTQRVSCTCETKNHSLIYSESTININHKLEDITFKTVKQDNYTTKHAKDEEVTNNSDTEKHLDEQLQSLYPNNDDIFNETITVIDIKPETECSKLSYNEPSTFATPVQETEISKDTIQFSPFRLPHTINNIEIQNANGSKICQSQKNALQPTNEATKMQTALMEFHHSPPADSCDKPKKIKANLNKLRHHRCKSKEDIDEFEKKYNFTITYLSREQILKVVQQRKLSDKYVNAKFRCEKCYTGFLYNRTFNNHQAAHNPSSGEFMCEFCKCRFKGKRRLNAHIQLHKLNIACNVCGRILRTYNKAKLHHKWHNGDKFSCKYCNRMLTAYSSYCEHLRVVHADQVSWCEKCGDTFVREFDLTRHLKKAHSEVTQSDSELKCVTCGTDFKSVEALRTHLDTSPDGACNPDMRACFKCGVNFDSHDSLRLHYLNTHRTVQCKECNETFSNKTAYKMHLYGAEKFKTHSPVVLRNLQKHCMCEICGMTFQAPAFLKIHHLKHTEEKPHKCAVCSKTFKYILGYKTHLYSHTGERPYKCSMCPKDFKSDSILKRHELIHSGVRRHECHICGKFFKTSTCVKTHVNSVHMKIHKPKSKHSKI